MASGSAIASSPRVAGRRAPAVTTATATRPTGIAAWRVGQLLSALVAGRASAHEVWLDTGEALVRARTPANLPAGTTLRLRVNSKGARVMLEIINQGAQQAEPVRSAVRGLVPRQASLTPLLANLGRLATPTSDSTGRVPARLPAAAQSLLDAIPYATRLGFADALQAALRESGLFLEARLARAAHGGKRPSIEHDFKGRLLRFIDTLPPDSGKPALSEQSRSVPDHPPLRHSPPRAQPRAMATLTGAESGADALAGVKNQATGALARVELTQLNAHPAQGGGYWLFELPMRQDDGIDVWQLRIEREPDDRATRDARATWTASLNFSLDEMGPVHVRVSVRDGRVSTLFQAERAATADRYSRALSELAALYQAHGLSVGALACHVGEPHAPAPSTSRVLDVRA